MTAVILTRRSSVPCYENRFPARSEHAEGRERMIQVVLIFGLVCIGALTVIPALLQYHYRWEGFRAELKQRRCDHPPARVKIFRNAIEGWTRCVDCGKFFGETE